ncbi:MAG: YrhK family protein [Alcanivorax sp.]|uniref:YrhK family protein n=1 Tax=Alloalcanivorax marinus TaxID=1177169 RepID=UPI00195C7972|nr:YrhK family protein [Alloalcanivorax marinus]MBM7335115.1 YrhK family protein [Alloalcanivorax marinus]MCH2556357.1 YrhK family protein [Alcanivorax sp.]
MAHRRADDPLTLHMGHEELVIRRRYETLSIINDFLIAIWFLVGSILFLYPSLAEPAAWLFIIGSFQFLIRPTLRLLSHIHLQRVPESDWER